MRGESFWQGYPSSYWRAVILDYHKLSNSGHPPSFWDKVLVWVGLQPPRPFDNHPIHNLWNSDALAVPVLRELLREPDPKIQLIVHACLIRTGPAAQAALPELRAALRGPPSRGRTNVAWVVWQLTHQIDDPLASLVEAVHSDDLQVRSEAIGTLRRIGPSAKAAVPDLLWSLNADDTTLRHITIEAVGAMGPAAAPAVPRLIALIETDGKPTEPLGDADTESRDNAGVISQAAIRALGSIGAPAHAALPNLERALADRKLCLTAAQALRRIDSHHQAPVDALTPLLLDPDESTRRCAAETLGEYGPAAKGALPALVPLLDDSTRGVRLAIARVIWQIDSDSARVMPVILSELRAPLDADWMPERTVKAVKLLADIGPAAERALPDLVAILQAEHPTEITTTVPGALDARTKKLMAQVHETEVSVLRAESARALGCMGPHGKEAVPALSLALKDKRAVVRNAAALALRRIDPTVQIDLASLTAPAGRDSWMVALTAVLSS